MSINVLPSEMCTPACTHISPQSANNTTKDTGWLDMRHFKQALFVLLLGAIDSTVDFKLQEAKDSSGTGAQDLAGKAITQLSNTNDDKLALINVSAEELAVNTGYTHVRARATLGNGTAQLVAALGLGLNPRFGPASDNKVATVVEIV